MFDPHLAIDVIKELTAKENAWIILFSLVHGLIIVLMFLIWRDIRWLKIVHQAKHADGSYKWYVPAKEISEQVTTSLLDRLREPGDSVVLTELEIEALREELGNAS